MSRVYPFPVASHNYFKIINKSEERERFLADITYLPRFIYNANVDYEDIVERLKVVDKSSSAYASLELVLSSMRLRQSKSMSELSRFRLLNERLFGSPSVEYIDMLMLHVRKFVTPSNMHAWEYIEVNLQNDFISNLNLEPDESTFKMYRRYFLEYVGSYILEDIKLPQLLELGLKKSGLDLFGWRVDVKSGDAHASVNHHNKTISIGDSYTPRKRKAAARIVAHEVYGHAVRGHQSSIAESEGFGVLLEQLIDERFMFRRSYRYLAASLAWGVMGEPVAFRQLHEIIWRIMYLVSGYDIDDAKRHAFDECVRVFRGGEPSIAGAVYMKDSLYFDANIRMWQFLISKPMQYNEFIDVIEGRRRILS